MPEPAEPNIPQELSDQLDNLRPVLQQQGAILTSGERCRLRYRAEEDGRRVHKSVELDGPDVAAAVTARLTDWREQYEAQRQAERAQVAEAMLKARQDELEWQRYAQLAAMGVALRGGNRRCQRAAVKIVKATAAGDCRAAVGVIYGGFPATRGKSGRPRKARLY